MVECTKCATPPENSPKINRSRRDRSQRRNPSRFAEISERDGNHIAKGWRSSAYPGNLPRSGPTLQGLNHACALCITPQTCVDPWEILFYCSAMAKKSPPAPRFSPGVKKLRESAPTYHANGNGTLRKLRFIDLFCGIGGFRLAFERAGGRCMFSSDWDKYSQLTYEANFGEKPHGDIHQVAVADIPTHDILCAGFPCQPFSIAGVS